MYITHSYREFVLPKIIELKYMNKELKSKLNKNNSSNIQEEFNQIKSKLLAEKAITKDDDIDKIIEHTQAHLEKL